MNNTTCHENFTLQYNDSWCPAVFDNYLCWQPTAPGLNVSLPCPPMRGLAKGIAYRICKEDGRWEDAKDNDSKGYTHYEGCLLRQLVDILKMCNEIKECPQIIRNTRNIELVLFRLIKYVDQELNAQDRVIERTPGLDETCSALLEYTKTAMFMWMFIEGLYLHNMITVMVFQEYSYIKLYFYIGWLAPAIMTAAWVITMVLVKSDWRFYYFLPYYWILEGPRSIIIVVNLLFLINIIRVLIVKLRESHTGEIEQVRKAVRAATFLLPLMGIANVFFWVDYRFTEAWKFAAWSYTSYFLNTFQGFFVAILYCFLNGEVQTAVKNSFYLHMSLRRHDYTPCRNLTLISTAPESETATEKDGTNWIRHCLKQLKKTPDVKDVNVCDLNGRRNSAIVTALTMVEPKPFTRTIDKVPRLSKEETDTTIIEDKSSETKV